MAPSAGNCVVDSEGSGAATTSADDSPETKSKGSPRERVKFKSVSSAETRDPDVIEKHCEEDDVVFVRPKLRGKIHLGLLVLAPVWVALLLSACRSISSIVAATISSLSFLANFTASALLHCGRWGPEWRSLVVKLDHAGIFVVISSCTTPIPVLLLDFWPSVVLLSVQGLATLYGKSRLQLPLHLTTHERLAAAAAQFSIILRVLHAKRAERVLAFCAGFWSILFGDLSSGARQRRAYTYIAIGLLHAVFLKAYLNVLTVKEIVLVLSLAGLYIVGALVYGSRWPDPCPTHFGFHELFHLFCGCSFLLTLWLNYEVISRAEAAGASDAVAASAAAAQAR
ncbi:hypothetical protein Emag_001498 [Eimeria magna]